MVVGVDLGHTIVGPNYGAVGILKESEETRNLGKKVIQNLKNSGVKVIDCSVDYAVSNSDSLTRRVRKANAQKLDLFVSIHFNSGGGSGSEVLTYKTSELSYAKEVLKGLSKLGFKNRGIKDGANLYVIRNTKAPSMLIEICFVDSENDAKNYRANIDNIAKVITEAIAGQSLGELVENLGDDDMIADSVKVCSNSLNPIASKMIKEIKALQKVMGLKEDGTATEKLVKSLPNLKGGESRGVVTIMQRILIYKGMLSEGSATGIVGDANKNGIKKFKELNGIPLDTDLVDRQTWRKLLEY